MVTAGGRSNWNNATGSIGSSGSSTSSSASPSSLSRRPKKGGKRRKRPCYKESCMLCPSFGYEGSVAVSCSRHKKSGMQNLTARRCQHVDCFTAANFGIPGDKPRFCLAHSTKDMVNRNKPRGGEGMGIIPSRSSRCTTKASNGVYGGNNTNNKDSGMLEAAPEADTQASEGSAGVRNRPVSAGGDITKYVGSAGKMFAINEGDHYGALRRVTSRDFESGSVTVGDDDSSPVLSMELTSKEDKSNGIIFHKRPSSSMSVWIPTPSWETVSVAFVSRGDGLDGPSVGGPEEAAPGGIIGGRNGRRVKEDIGPATVPREPYCHDDVIVTHRVETDDFEKHPPSNVKDVPGDVPDRRGGVNAPFNVNFVGDVGNSGDIMNGGGSSFFMDGLNSLDDDDKVDSDMGFQIGATLEELLLGVGRNDDVREDLDSKGSRDEEAFRGKCLSPSANANVMRASVELGLNSHKCINFEIGHLSGLNSGVHTKNSCQDTRPQQQQANGIRVTSDIGDMSSLTPSSSSSGDAAVRSISTPVTSTPTLATSQGTPSVPGTPMAPDALISPKHPVEQVWWNDLEGKDVTMSEILWEPTAEEQELASECDVIRYNIYHDYENLGEGDGVTLGESTDGGNRSMDVGEACLNPPLKRHRYSLSGLVPSGSFSSPSGSQHSTVPSSPLPAEFGLTIATPLIHPLHAGLINMEGDDSVAGEMPQSSSGVMGGSEQGDNRRISSGNSMEDVLLNEDDVCLGQPGFVDDSSSLPVHIAMGN